MSKLETRKVVLLSTAHLRPGTCRKLETTRQDTWPVAGGEREHGFYIYAHDEDGSGEITAFAPELWAALSFARKEGFDYVQFDCDAEPIDQLEVFDHG